MVPVTPPAPVQTAHRLWRWSAAASVLASAMAVPIAGEVAAARGVPLQADPTLVAGALIGVLVTAVVAGVVLLLAARMRSGASWARIVLALLGAVIVVTGLLSLSGTLALFGVGVLGAAVAVLSLASLVLVAAAVSFMFRPEAGDWFDR